MLNESLCEELGGGGAHEVLFHFSGFHVHNRLPSPLQFLHTNLLSAKKAT